MHCYMLNKGVMGWDGRSFQHCVCDVSAHNMTHILQPLDDGVYGSLCGGDHRVNRDLNSKPNSFRLMLHARHFVWRSISDVLSVLDCVFGCSTVVSS